MTDKTRIDGQKMDLHPARMAAWLEARHDWDKAKHIFPIYIEVSPVGVCNHQCTFCSVDYVLQRPDAPRIPLDVMERTLSNMAAHGVLSVMFAGCGEPLLYRDRQTGKNLSHVIGHADACGLDIAVTSNAVLMTEDFCRQAFEARRFRWFRASVNGGDRETYAKLHRTKPEDFDTVMKNLERAVKIRETVGSKMQILAQIVAVPGVHGKGRRSLLEENYPSNLHTIAMLARIMRDIGVDNLAIKPFKQHTVELDRTGSKMYGNVSYRELTDAFLEVEALQTDKFEVTVRYGAMDQHDTDYRGYDICHSTPFHWAYIEADGEVWGCSAHVGYIHDGKEVTGDHRFRFGNVNHAFFSDIWRGDRRKACWEYTRKLPCDGGLDVSKCMKGCQMDMPNVYLQQLTNPGPLVNFVK